MVIKKAARVTFATISFAMIFILVLANPASAWEVSLHEFSNANPVQGEIIQAKFNLKLTQETKLGFDKIVVALEGPESASCNFDIMGEQISSKQKRDDTTSRTQTQTIVSTTPSQNTEVTSTNTITLNSNKLAAPRSLALEIQAPNVPTPTPLSQDPKKTTHKKMSKIITTPKICNDIKIEMIPLEQYDESLGHGYGYENFSYLGNETALMVTGNMPYLLTIDTTNLPFGEYKSKVTLFLTGKTPESHESNFQSFTVTNVPIDGGDDDNNNNHNKKHPWEIIHLTGEGSPSAAPTNPANNSGPLIPLAPETPSFFSRITGAVTGPLGNVGMAIIALVIVAIVGSAVALQVRRKLVTNAASAGAAASTSSAKTATPEVAA